MATADTIVKTLSAIKPQFRNEFDAIVAVLHLSMKEVGFRCIGLSESTANNAELSEALPTGWNQHSDAYCFLYKHAQSAMTFVVKSLVMNDRLLVHGVAKEDNKICSLELRVSDYIKENALNNYETLFTDLDKLISLFKINIIVKFLPDLCKPGYEHNNTEVHTSSGPTRSAPPQREGPYDPYYPPPIHDPLRIPGTGNRPMRGYPSFGVGYGDLHPPFTGAGVPGAQGNLVGPNHPAFGPRVNDPYARDYNFPFGALGPRGTVPGARFDPLGPPPPSNTFNSPRQNNFGDELPPPGFDNMYL